RSGRRNNEHRGTTRVKRRAPAGYSRATRRGHWRAIRRRLHRLLPRLSVPLICILLVSHSCMLILGACAVRPAVSRLASESPGAELAGQGDEIVVCGRLFHTGTRVVLWPDPGGFDAYRVQRRFTNRNRILPARPVEGANTPMRYSPMRDGLPDALAARIR